MLVNFMHYLPLISVFPYNAISILLSRRVKTVNQLFSLFIIHWKISLPDHLQSPPSSCVPPPDAWWSAVGWFCCPRWIPDSSLTHRNTSGPLFWNAVNNFTFHDSKDLFLNDSRKMFKNALKKLPISFKLIIKVQLRKGFHSLLDKKPHS